MSDIVFPFTANFTFSPENPHFGDTKVTFQNECRNRVDCSCWSECSCRKAYDEHGDVTRLRCYPGDEESTCGHSCGGIPYDWTSWDFGDGTRLGFPGEGSPCYPNDPDVPRPDTPTHVYQQPGTYTVSVIMWVQYNYTKPDSGWGGYPTYVYPAQNVLRLYAETGKSYTVNVAGDTVDQLKGVFPNAKPTMFYGIRGVKIF